MKYLNGNYYVEVKDKRYRVHPTKNIILRLRDEPKFLRTQYQVQNDTQIKKIQRGIKNDNDELVDKNYPKNKQANIHHPIFELPHCPSCKQNNWFEFNKSYYFQNDYCVINKQKHQVDKKVRRQDQNFSTTLPHAKK